MNKSYQERVHEWAVACFAEDAADVTERNHRFLEEALELYQAVGASREEALALVDYVFGRPVGEAKKEIGGVALTLNSLASALGITVEGRAEEELLRVWQIIDKIKAKRATRVKGSSLPGQTPI